jgi:hypothetical protein
VLSYDKRVRWQWLVLAVAWAVLPPAAQAARPNVVLILIDDLSHYGVTAYGADRIIEWSGLFESQKFSTPRKWAPRNTLRSVVRHSGMGVHPFRRHWSGIDDP